MSRNDESISLVAVGRFITWAGIAVIRNKQPDGIVRGFSGFLMKWGNQFSYTAMKREHLIQRNILDFLVEILPSMYRL